MRRLALVALAATVLISPSVDGGLPRCGSWFTVARTAKSYGPCNQTMIGPWTSPLGGCLQWVSWKRTQQRAPYFRAPYREQRVLLENEVRARWTVDIGPVLIHKTQTIPGSHTTKVMSTTRLSGSIPCTP